MRRWPPRSPPDRCAPSSSGDVLRIGWDEPDWLGPGRLVVPGSPPNLWSASHAFAIAADWLHAIGPPGRRVGVRAALRGARGTRRHSRTGEFAQPSVMWHFDPARRADGGAPDGMRAFGYQYTEFALPVFSDDAMSRWRLLPIRPPVVLPLGLVAPDGRTILLAPLNAFHEQVIAVPSGSGQRRRRPPRRLARRHRRGRGGIRDRARDHRGARRARVLRDLGAAVARGVARRPARA